MTDDFKARRSGGNARRSPEEYKQFKKEEKEGVYRLIDDAIADIASTPAELQKYLDTQARMDRYSAANALLIYKQCPEATRLKDFDGWRDEKVRIRKGAKSISILEPVDYTRADGSTGISYNVKKVFDVSQTSGRRQPAPTLNRDPRNLVTVMLNTSPVNCESAEQLANAAVSILLLALVFYLHYEALEIANISYFFKIALVFLWVVWYDKSAT